jgi:hypothetical protein
MTFLQLRVLTSGLLDDVDNGYFSVSQVNTWLNNAQKEVQKILNQAFEGHTIVKKQTTLVPSQREYALPSDFKRLHTINVVMQGTTTADLVVQPLTKITRNQQYLVNNQTGTPQGYYFQGNYIVLVPAPDLARTMYMEYEYLIADMVLDADQPDLPPQYHEMIALYACRKGLLKDGRDAALAQKEISDFETGLKRDAEQRNADAPRTVVQTMDDDNGGDFIF